MYANPSFYSRRRALGPDVLKRREVAAESACGILCAKATDPSHMGEETHAGTQHLLWLNWM